MARKRQDFQMWAGETVEIIINIFDKEGNKADLTDITEAEFSIAKHRLSDEKIIHKSGEDIDVRDHSLRLVLKPEETLDFGNDEYRLYHETRLKDYYEQVNTVTVGHVTINPSVYVS